MAESPLCWGNSIPGFSRAPGGPPGRDGGCTRLFCEDTGESASTSRAGSLGDRSRSAWTGATTRMQKAVKCGLFPTRALTTKPSAPSSRRSSTPETSRPPNAPGRAVGATFLRERGSPHRGPRWRRAMVRGRGRPARRHRVRREGPGAPRRGPLHRHLQVRGAAGAHRSVPGGHPGVRRPARDGHHAAAGRQDRGALLAPHGAVREPGSGAHPQPERGRAGRDRVGYPPIPIAPRTRRERPALARPAGGPGGLRAPGQDGRVEAHRCRCRGCR
jgi:hypothetical protein